ncbi:hypothetical protein BFP72_04865 [Reichenbachiella sp. 5M10]|uniref:hypothetical protein n=1 Tax=Reichenbachiella sp. 5M10 TaxID=1889772 RepID=UPI000C1581A6|nr:hypothetical protein [Reichenbachiella sp. 5M10]PIB34782.1 hypothetical protein BFP72_04865 [Reichenbachiella sp. 5M10]
MKSIIGVFVFVLACYVVEAQPKKVKTRDLNGVWQLKIDLGEEFLEEEMEDEDNAFARVILQATGSFVNGILDELDIRFEFLPDNRCMVYVSAFDSDTEIEEARWEINRDGQLVISDTDSFQTSDEEYWMMQDDILIAMKDGEVLEDDARIYMVRLDN